MPNTRRASKEISFDASSKSTPTKALRPIDVRRAHRLAAHGRIDSIKGCLAEAGSRSTTSRLILEAVIAQYAGDIDRCLAYFGRALSGAAVGERAYVVDLYCPVLLMQRRFVAAREALSAVHHVPDELTVLFDTMRSLVAAMCGEHVDATPLLAGRALDGLHRARALQRVSLAAYYSLDFEVAIDAARNSARIFERVGAYRSAAASFSVLYGIHHTVTGDVDEAYRYAKLLCDAARKARDASFEIAGLIAQYEISAEFGEAPMLERLRASVNRLSMPTQYRERFSRGIADALPCGWAADFEALGANATMLRELPGASRPFLALASALRSIADAALGDVASARRNSRNAIGIAGFAGSEEPAHDSRYRRLAKAIAAAACALIGDSVRGKRTMQAKALCEDDAFDIYSVAFAGDWRQANRRVRGYARVVFAARTKLAASRRIQAATPSNILTSSEYEVLSLLAEGKSALQVALELNRSVHTVRAHTRNIIGKFEVSGRGSAISYARKVGIII